MGRSDDDKVDALLRSKSPSPDLAPAVMSALSQPSGARRARVRWSRVVITALLLFSAGTCTGYWAAMHHAF